MMEKGKLPQTLKKAAAEAREDQIGQILETITALGLVRKTEDGGYVR